MCMDGVALCNRMQSWTSCLGDLPCEFGGEIVEDVLVLLWNSHLCLSCPTRPLLGPYWALTRLIFTDFYRFFGLSWETSPQTDLTPEASKRSGSRRIEFSSKSTTFLM